jgi:N-acetylglucosaminyldiphosphoundecaprenol N-acetyl-beta-D-mannosaminyltransferase
LSFDRCDLLGIPVDAVDMVETLYFVRERIVQRNPTQIVTVNSEFIVLSQTDPDFARALRAADLHTPDSAGVVWAMRRRGFHVPQRVGGADLIWLSSEQASRLGHRIFLLGARDGVAEMAAAELRRRYPDLQVAGTFAGSPAPADEASIVDLIRRAGPDILFVAFGAPPQDKWIARNLLATGVTVAIGVGGSFDYVAGITQRAPHWMQRSGLDWLWRLIRQPWRWRRMLALPRFIWMVWRSERRTLKGQSGEQPGG